MDDFVLSLPIYETAYDELIDNESFCNFWEACNELDDFHRDNTFVFEAVNDKPIGFKKRVGEAHKNAKDAADKGWLIYDNLTGAKAAAFKATYDLTTSAIGLISKVIFKVFTILSSIPKTLSNVVNKIGEIPQDIKNKIKGNIKLYITIDDINTMYNESLLERLDKCISLLHSISLGDTWKKFFKLFLPGIGVFGPTPIKDYDVNKLRRAVEDMKDGNGLKSSVGQERGSDFKLAKKLKAEYKKIQNIEFKQSVVEMNENNIEIYFANKESVKFKDIKGKVHNTSYYGALQQMVADLDSRKNDLDHFQTLFGEKIDKTHMNQSFAKLTTLQQNLLSETMMETSKVLGIIANVTRYITVDMKTIEKTLNKLISAGKVSKNSK